MTLQEINQAIDERLKADGLSDAPTGSISDQSSELGHTIITMTVSGRPYCSYTVRGSLFNAYATDLVWHCEPKLTPHMHDGTAITAFKGINKFLRKREAQP